jgi:poly(A) polymerase
VGRTLRTPGAPEDSFADDPLRMLRAARFAAQLRFTVAPEVVAAITRMASDLRRIASERIRDEFTKLLCGTDPVAGLRLLVDTALADYFLPELSGLKLEIDEHAQHKDVYEHTLTVVRNAIGFEDDGPDFTLRMAALMHDVGKPATKAIGPDGGVSFHHHEVVGARLTRQRMKELNLARVRPDLDGNAIMELLGVPPGPVVGRAWRHLKDLRLERGPLPREEAEAELMRWASEQGLR